MKRLSTLFRGMGITTGWISAICNIIEAGRLHNQNFGSVDAIFHIGEAIAMLLVVIACERKGD